MVYLVHGDNIVTSRKKLDEYVAPWAIRVNGAKITLLEITQTIESGELFIQKKTVIIENLFSPKTGRRQEEILTYLQSFLKDSSLTIVIWQGGEVNKLTLKKLTFSDVFLFNFPKLYYQFLDTIQPSTGKRTFQMAQEIRSNREVSDDQLFYSLVKRIRYLIMAKTKKRNEISEFGAISDWQKTKLMRQATYWTEQELVDIYSKLYELEIGLKTSQLPLSLKEHIDILLLTELN